MLGPSPVNPVTDATFGVEKRLFPNSDVGAAVFSPEPSMHAPLSRLGDVHASITKTRGKRAAAAQEADDAQTEAADAVGGAEAELGGKLRGVFVSYMREQLGDSGLSDDQVLEHITAFPNLNDSTLMRRLAGAAGLYGSEEGEDNVAPAQKKALVERLLLALTSDVDWKTELATPATDVANGVTTDAKVLHGANEMTIAQAAAAAKDNIRETLTSKLGDWAVPIADALAPVLINDPTLFLPKASGKILYGSLEWAQLWIGIEYAEGQSLDPAKLTIDQLLALGRAATITDPATDEEATEAVTNGDTAEDDAAAAAYSVTKLLALIARAKGKLDGQEITEENRAEVEEVLQSVAEEVFKEEFAIAEAFETLGQEMPTREEVARKILEEHKFDPDEKITDWRHSPDGITYRYNSTRERTLAEIYFEQGNLDGYRDCDLPNLTEEFETRFETYKSQYAAGMTTIFGRFLDDYAERNNLDLTGAAIKLSQPQATASINNGNWWSDKTEKSNSVLIVEMTIPEAGSRYGFFSLPELDKGLQDIPAETSVNDWVYNNSSTFYTEEQVDEYTNFLNAPGFHVAENSVTIKELCSGAGAEIRGKINEYFAAQIQQYHDQARGETPGEAISNFFLDLIPFRAIVVAIQKGDVAGAIFNGLFDVLSFIPFVGEGIKALQVGGKAVVTGLSAALKTSLKQGLSKGISAGLRTAASFGREFGGQTLKAAVTGLESVMPIPMPSLASHISVAGAGNTARVVKGLRATQPELADALEQVSKRSDIIEMTADGQQKLAPGVEVTKGANGVETIKLDAIHLPLGEGSIDLDDARLTIRYTDEDQILFLNEHFNEAGESFYTLANPQTGLSYGRRLTPDETDTLLSKGSSGFSRETRDNFATASTEDPAHLNTSEAENNSFLGSRSLFGRIFKRKLKVKMPKYLVIADTPKYENVVPELTSFTARIQSNGGGLCASFVIRWIQYLYDSKNIALDLKLQNNLISAQSDYIKNFRGRISDKSLLESRKLYIYKEIPQSRHNTIQNIINSSNNRDYIYMFFIGESGAGHAVGLTFGDNPKFFDPNWGVFKFENRDDLAKWVPEYIQEHYKNISQVGAFSVKKRAWGD
ncbi:YopT-type cysteine protease domain-containing protein [Chelativorans xinjiangense]|uniref:YopT-type cysteine protease domain-containing protein n=1 Tax=Chelativorans xinjiangense TaxID=2681485 RepID=UPI00135BE362|nr:YopT-type cysteine protease domain-containing protein [Chelativorans xinjiangense]